MKAIALRRDAATPDVLIDRVMCHDVRDPHRRVVVPKGARVDAATAATLLSVPWDEIDLLALDPGDVHEEEAGERLATAVVGGGGAEKGYTGVELAVTARRRGLATVAAGAVARLHGR